MALLTIVDAVRLTGVSRAQLYRLLKAGRLSRTPEGFLDTAELLRAGLLLRLPETPATVSPRHEETPTVSSDVSPVSHPVLERLIDVLQHELEDARRSLREAHERETQLIQMLSQMQQHNQRLLDLPRTPPQSPQEAPDATQAPRRPLSRPTRPGPPQRQPGTAPVGSRSAMRRRIVSLLLLYPAGLTPREMQERLGVERSLTDTCQGMLRYGLLQRVGRGRYVAAKTREE